MEDKSLTVDRERVLDAAAKCPDARKVLETLFPEAFAPQGVIITMDPSVTGCYRVGDWIGAITFTRDADSAMAGVAVFVGALAVIATGLILLGMLVYGLIAVW